jgi:hypothetical protein
MADEREEVSLRELSRWLVLALVVLGGVTLYFVVGREAPPVVPATVLETAQ